MSLMLGELTAKVLNGESIGFAEAMQLMELADTQELFESANRIREHFTGNRVDLCSIMNAKSGRCSENCKFCAQSGHYRTGVVEYPLVGVAEALQTAQMNERAGVHRFSLVTSGKVLEGPEFEQVIAIYAALKEKTSLYLCASLGCISYEQALRLKEAGVEMYHHNLETSRNFYPRICDTHTYDDRIRTIHNVKRAGLEVCCGGIIGLGEPPEERFRMALAIRELGVKSIPVNILNPIPGTPLEGTQRLEPVAILKTIAIFRFLLPDSMIRYAGGRAILGELQRTGLMAGVNAALVGDFLTTVGNKISDDLKMIEEAGLTY
jgi:biotin synthase